MFVVANTMLESKTVSSQLGRLHKLTGFPTKALGSPSHERDLLNVSDANADLEHDVVHPCGCVTRRQNVL